MTEKVLFLDDDMNILNAVSRVFDDSGMEITTTNDPQIALDIIHKGEVAVVVSDNMMPGLLGTDFLARVRALCPDTVRIMFSGYADFSSAIEAINRCEVYKFIMKPWNNSELISIIREGLDRHRLIRTLRTSDEPTLLSLAQTIELRDPYTRGHCDSVAYFALTIAETLGLPEDTQVQIKYGSWLHDCGKIGVPEAILNKTGPLTPEEYDVIKKHPVWGAEVAKQAMLSHIAVDIIQSHHERWDGAGYPIGIGMTDIPLEARIVSIADIFDALTSDRSYRKQHHRLDAMGILYSMKGTFFDPDLTDVFLDVIIQEAEDSENRQEAL